MVKPNLKAIQGGKVTPVTAWRTTDGKTWPTSEEANQHQAVLDFHVWYQGHQHFQVSTKEMLTWLMDNAKDLAPLLKAVLKAETI